jgi:hypothetical protein
MVFLVIPSFSVSYQKLFMHSCIVLRTIFPVHLLLLHLLILIIFGKENKLWSSLNKYLQSRTYSFSDDRHQIQTVDIMIRKPIDLPLPQIASIVSKTSCYIGWAADTKRWNDLHVVSEILNRVWLSWSFSDTILETGLKRTGSSTHYTPYCLPLRMIICVMYC